MASNFVNSDISANSNQHSILPHFKMDQPDLPNSTHSDAPPQSSSLLFPSPRMTFYPNPTTSPETDNLCNQFSQFSINSSFPPRSPYSSFSPIMPYPQFPPPNLHLSYSPNGAHKTPSGLDSGVGMHPSALINYPRESRGERMPDYYSYGRYPPRMSGPFMRESLSPYDLGQNQSPFWGECPTNYAPPWMYFQPGETHPHSRMWNSHMTPNNKPRLDHPRFIPSFMSTPKCDNVYDGYSESDSGRPIPSPNFDYLVNYSPTSGYSPSIDSPRGMTNVSRGGRLKPCFEPTRNSMLEEFRSSRLPYLKLSDIRGSVVDFSKDQHGSRFIQQKLEKADEGEKGDIFEEISSCTYSLMTDVFGNYVIQKFFEFGTPQHKERLCLQLKGQVLGLTLHMYGCRVVQKAMECVGTDLQVEIAGELRGQVIRCVRDQNGNHVIQKCIECFPPLHLDFIIDSFRGQVFDLSTHSYGCRVIQRILEHCPEWQTVHVLEELHRDTDKLMKDQYGNYVIQHVILRGKPSDRSNIIKVVKGRLVELSQHKFASNVVEKCIVNALPSERGHLIEEIISDQAGFCALIKDQYGNYVVQKMLEISEEEQRRVMLCRIHAHENVLKKYTYGKHVLARLDRM